MSLTGRWVSNKVSLLLGKLLDYSWVDPTTSSCSSSNPIIVLTTLLPLINPDITSICGRISHMASLSKAWVSQSK